MYASPILSSTLKGPMYLGSNLLLSLLTTLLGRLAVDNKTNEFRSNSFVFLRPLLSACSF